MEEPLHLRWPAPAVRPGGEPTFDHLVTTPAGSVRRPPVDVDPAQIQDLVQPVIRVLDDDGAAVGEWGRAVDLDDDALLEGLRHMLTLRAYDARMMTAQRQQKTSFYMQHLGEEAISCAARRAMRDGDMAFPTYRQAGLLIAAGYPLLDMMNQIYSNADDPIRGRQLPVMYSVKEYGYFSISGNLATQFIQAVGWAMASAIRGDSKIATAWIGDGSTAEGDFHAALTFASTYHAPVVLNVVNNQWAISTYQSIARGDAATFASRGLGFGLPSLRVDGNDYLAVYAVSRWAADRARRSLGPTLIEHVTYRGGGHSTSDDPTAYRVAEEGKAWPLGDPVTRLRDHLIHRGVWSESQHEELAAEVLAEVVATQKQAEAIGTLHSGRRPSPRGIFDDVYEQMPAHLVKQRQEAGF